MRLIEFVGDRNSPPHESCHAKDVRQLRPASAREMLQVTEWQFDDKSRALPFSVAVSVDGPLM